MGILYLKVVIFMNIFLTGLQDVGKTTILDKLCKELCFKRAGFFTKPILINNTVDHFVMHSYLDITNSFIIGTKDTPTSCVPNSIGFETCGVDILQKSLEIKNHIIVLDELGFLENNSPLFQSKVHQCLDSNQLVIGIIKPRASHFLDSIRNRNDVFVLEVTSTNRNMIFKKVADLLATEIKIDRY